MPKELHWLPQAALDRMHSDLQLHGDLTRAQLAERIIEDAAPLAAYTIVEMATGAEDENTRLRAAQDVLDRANGKAKTSIQLNTTEQNPVLRILEGVVVQPPATSEQTATTETPAATVIEQDPFSPKFDAE